MLADNLTAKAHFRDTIGYDSLKDVLLRCACDPKTILPGKQRMLDGRVLPCLLDLLVDGQFSLARRFTIVNVDAIDLVLQLAPHFDEESHQRALLSTLLTILQASPTNRSICCDHHALYRLLQLLSDMRNETLVDLW